MNSASFLFPLKVFNVTTIDMVPSVGTKIYYKTYKFVVVQGFEKFLKFLKIVCN